MTQPETEPFTKSLERMNLFQEPEARALIADLDLPEGSRGLDVGCGVGLFALWLAEAIGPRGRVVGIEPSTERVEAARDGRPRARRLAPRVPRGGRHQARRARRDVRLGLVRRRPPPRPGDGPGAGRVCARRSPRWPDRREGVPAPAWSFPARPSRPRASPAPGRDGVEPARGRGVLL